MSLFFAEAKDWHGSRRFRLRGLEKVEAEAPLIALGQNIKKLLAFGEMRRWPPCASRLLTHTSSVAYGSIAGDTLGVHRVYFNTLTPSRL